jgi:hypothetical protein
LRYSAIICPNFGFEVETFVAELAVATLRDAILPRFGGIDQRAAESCATIEDRPLSTALINQLRAVLLERGITVEQGRRELQRQLAGMNGQGLSVDECLF